MAWCNKPRCFVVTCVAVALVLIILAAIAYPLLDKIVKKEITKNVVLTKGSQLYEIWKGGKIPITFEIYMFNLTNPDDVLNNGSKPNVTQIGPFVYTETRTKFNITYHKNGTVSYRENKTFVFDAQKSVANDTTNITTIDIPLMAVMSFLNKHNVDVWSVVKDLVKFFFDKTGETVFITRSVREIVWGYDDPLLQFLKKWLPSTLKRLIPSTKIGVLYGQNNTNDGLYTVFTGEKDTAKLGVIDKWNGVSSLNNVWSSKYANKINGTDGTVAPPFIVDKNFKVVMYSTDICRSVYGTYFKKVNLHGVDLYRFSSPKELYQNASINKDNAGFCTPAGNCFDSGVLDNSKCHTLGGLSIPIMTSSPHFHFGAKKYIDAIIGMNPNQPGLTTDIDVEPLTGLVMNAAKRLQLNIYVNKSKITKEFLGKVPTMIYPVMWINETATSDNKHSETVKSQLDTISYVHIAQIVLFGVALCFLIAAIAVCVLCKNARIKTSEQEPLLSTAGDDEQDRGGYHAIE